ncbi:hypothetical protein V5799_027945 [Amblyomma americanum]|uniref:Purple acid phosphatase n=1 Tax=Amblyomma americanum TaxID=6943 RepID=A0AAQ4DE96_AMBAM
MVVTWTTFDPTNESVVEFGENGLDRRATGYSSKFYDGGSERRLIFIHRVVLEDLRPGAFHVYHCGSRMGWSATFWFRSKNASAHWSPRLAVFGDMGNVNAQSLPFLQEEAQKGTIDAALHVGDFAYNMDSDNARVGDEFMRQIEPVAAYVPYMTCVGNHENAYNFSNYVNRFSMVDSAGRVNNHFFSFDIGPAHIISLSTEFYFFLEYGFMQIKHQYEWLEQDLKEATRSERRRERPWIITMGHRPMYCSNNDRDDCTMYESIIRGESHYGQSSGTDFAVMVGDVHGNHEGEGTVQTFSEAVRLRMVGRGELMTDGAGAEEFGDHFGKKAATAIGEQVTGSTVVEYDVVQEKISGISCAAGWDRSSNSVARGVVRRGRDPFVSHSRHRKRAEQVEADTGKRVYGDGNRLKVPGRENRGRLPPLAQFASGHITADRTV